jgi:hypothetical protein
MFLNGYLEEKIYMRQLDGFIQTTKDNLVLKLHKNLYKLQQSPWAWYDRIDTYLIKIGFIHNIDDTNVYMKKVENSLMIIALFVDGYIISFNDPHKLLPQIIFFKSQNLKWLIWGKLNISLEFILHTIDNKRQSISIKQNI